MKLVFFAKIRMDYVETFTPIDELVTIKLVVDMTPSRCKILKIDAKKTFLE
jgi:hypothetical protein